MLRKVILMSLVYSFARFALAAPTADGLIQVECTGGSSNAQVAIRWGHPYHNTAEYFPLFTVPCGTGMHQVHATLTALNSEFEIQTEGGIRTAYTINASVTKDKVLEGTFEATHAGSPEVITRGSGFTLKRSAGPNKYGEQNFRVLIPNGTASDVRIVAQVTGDRSNAQMALRWGHTDFNDHEYFHLWKVTAGAAQTQSFHLANPKSEFEIQTEGGEGTAYHLSIWLGGIGAASMQPNIEIIHKLQATERESSSNGPNGATFSWTHGNVYGEMNVGVTVPGLPAEPLPPVQVVFTPQPRAGSGPVPYVGQLGYGAPNQGHFSEVQNGPTTSIELVKIGGGATSDDCFKGTDKTAKLTPNAIMSGADFNRIFGSNPPYPTAIVGCADSNVTNFTVYFTTTPN